MHIHLSVHNLFLPSQVCLKRVASGQIDASLSGMAIKSSRLEHFSIEPMVTWGSPT